jgi:hypothetical protein
MSLVLPGLTDVFASPVRFTSILINDDFPTLDLPMKANSGILVLGQSAMEGLLIVNSAECMIMMDSIIEQR